MGHLKSFLRWTLLTMSAIFLSQIKSSSAVDIYASPQEFCYSDPSCDPNSSVWNGTCKTGTRQSPLNLYVSLKQSPLYRNLPRQNLRADYFFLQNNGHTVNFNFAMPSPGLFPGYGLTNTKYTFANAHFHWGKTNNNGSEHRIEGQAFSMELHLVHFNAKYKSVVEAVASGDSNGLAVVGIFLQVGEYTRPNQALAPIVNNLNKVRDSESYWERIDEPLDLTSLVPQVDDLLYNYQGSLTTPTCNEQVNWYVFQTPSLISKSDVDAFRGVHDGEGEPLLQNHRPVQKVNNRRIDVVVINGY